MLILLAKELGVEIYEAKPYLVDRTFSIKVDRLKVLPVAFFSLCGCGLVGSGGENMKNHKIL